MNASPPTSDAGWSTSLDDLGRRLDPAERALVTHDLRTALHGILAGLAVVDREVLPRDMREQLDRVITSAEQVTCLLYLLFGDLPEGFDPTLGLEFAHVDLPRMLDFLRRRWAAEARRRNMTLRIVAEAEAPTLIHVDLISLARMLNNLVGDAVRQGGGSKLDLVASGTPDGGLRLRLSESGVGTQDRPRADPAEGARSPIFAEGLGPRVARRLAAEIGAELRLVSRPDGGSEAVVELAPDKCARGPLAEPETDLAGTRILLAEDNLTNQMVATQMLRALRAEVVVTSDGAEALAAFETGHFDLVLLDIEMPRVSGLEVIRRIRARGDARAKVPIVALTAYALREHQERIARAGANGLISKPIAGIEALGRALARHLPRPARDPGAQSAADAAIVDPAIYAALAQAIGEELMAELIEKVIADLRAARAELDAARTTPDIGAIRSASHILISVAGAIGATQLQTLARGLNARAHAEGALEPDVESCVEAIDAVLVFLSTAR